MYAYNHLHIDLASIKKNLESLQNLLPKRGRIMPMIKANAHGTDAHVLSNHFKKWGIPIVGVSHVNEAVGLRENGCDLAIFAIHAAPFEVAAVVHHDIEVAVSEEAFCRLLNDEALKQGEKIKVHLDINTGLHRFGCRPKAALALAQVILSLPGLILEGVMTHFAAAEDPEFNDFTLQQVDFFKKVITELNNAHINPPWIHGANSAALLRQLLPFCNMVRIGIATFGFYSSETEEKLLPLYPALSLESKITALSTCNKGESVGYLRNFIATRDKTRIAILPIGYHDGIHLQYSGKGFVLIHGKKAPYIGRICMDFMMCDVTDIPEAEIGASALLFGKDREGNTLPLELFASWGNGNVREVLVSIGPRVARSFHLQHLESIPLAEFLGKQSLSQELSC